MSLTPLQFFLKWAKETPDNVFLRQPKDDQWYVYSYRKASEEISRAVRGIRQLNLPPQSRIAILSKNCAHWLMADLAIMMSGHISVPIYPTLSAKGVSDILTHSEAAAIFIGKLDNYPEQNSGIPDKIIKLSFSFYGIAEGITWEQWQKNEPETNMVNPGEDELATIMYSSGTTGTPKGVMLTHGSFGYVGIQVMHALQITKQERFFSYLPLSHIAERALMEMVALASGSSISFAESLEKFADNLQHERPTIFGGVPRIYMKFQEGVLKKIPQNKLDRFLGIPLVNTFIRKTIRKKLGLDQARIVVSGAAPTPSALIEWFDKIGIKVRETYGMTENTAFSHSNYGKIKLDTVGQPFSGVECKISNEGEILIRHKALMIGYYKDEDTTKNVFTHDGFLKTGDMGTIDNENFLTITGRIKDQFKTDKAKFIAPAPIELKLLVNRDIEQVCVVGTGIPQPIALITLNALAKSKSKDEVEKNLRATLEEVNNSLESFEVLQSIVILKEDWTIENGLLTPSLKVKRNELEKKFHEGYRKWYDNESKIVWDI